MEFGDIPNSLEAFQRSIEMGVDCIEVDLSMTKDDVLVAAHYRDILQRMHTKVSEPIHRIMSHDLFDVGVSRFEEIFHLALKRGVQVIVDVKTTEKDKSGILLERLVNILEEQARRRTSRVIVWCKDDDIIKKIHETMSTWHDVQTGLIVMDMEGKTDPFRVPETQYAGLNVIAQHWAFGSYEQVQMLSEKGKQVLLWTADTPHMMAMSLEQHPEAIVTSYPRRLLEMMDTWRQQCIERENDEL